MTRQSHPSCDHGVSYGPDSFDVTCCICETNPCDRVTVAQMAAHRDYDIEVWTRREVAGDVAPF